MRYWCAIVCGWAVGFGLWFARHEQQPDLLAPVAAAVVAFVVYKAL